MGREVKLRHMYHSLPRRFEPFYDGSTVAVDGLITLPVEHIHHIRAAFMRGYKVTEDGKTLRDETELMAYISA